MSGLLILVICCVHIGFFRGALQLCLSHKFKKKIRSIVIISRTINSQKMSQLKKEENQQIFTKKSNFKQANKQRLKRKMKKNINLSKPQAASQTELNHIKK